MPQPADTREKSTSARRGSFLAAKRVPAASPGVISRVLLALVICFARVIGAGCARANDSTAEVALGGLTLTKSDAISMDSEDLYISRDRVRVKYRFTNTTDAPIDTLVAFPLPEIPAGSEDDNTAYWTDPASGLKFKTTVDGQPLALQVVEQALFNGRDISAKLSSLRIPLNRFAKDFDTAINRLPKSERDRLYGRWLHSQRRRRRQSDLGRAVVVAHDADPTSDVPGAPDDRRRA